MKLVNTAQKRSREKPRLAQKLKRAKQLQCSTVPASASSVPESEAEQGEGYWWEEYDKSQIVAFDVEFVTLLEKDERGEYQRLAMKNEMKNRADTFDLEQFSDIK